MADVAERAGVSIGIVSNVLNGVIAVSAKTRQRVVDAIFLLHRIDNAIDGTQSIELAAEIIFRDSVRDLRAPAR